MKKLRGFTLGKRLVRVWRWVRRRRRLMHRAYISLAHTMTAESSSRSPHIYSQPQHHKKATAVKAKIADWGRSLTRRFGPSSVTCRSRRGGREVREEDGHLLPTQGPEEDKRGLRRHLRKQQRRREEGGEREEGAWWKPPPKGHLAVYVGRKGVEPPRRVLVPVVYFNHPLFGGLLREAEEEFGYHHPGGITIPCPVADFESVRRRVAAGLGCPRATRSTAGWRC